MDQIKMAMNPTIAANISPNADTLITIKVQLAGETRRFKLALRDLGANTLPDKLRFLLSIPVNQTVLFERYSDSAGSYITLDSKNPSVYKQLHRAAKAKLKLRLKATVTDDAPSTPEVIESTPAAPDRLSPHRYVPPMNPDPVKSNSIRVKDLLSNNVAPVLTIATSVPAAQAPEEQQRLAYGQYLLQQTPTVAKQPQEPPTVSAIRSEDKIKMEPSVKEEAADEAPVPRPFSARDQFRAELASMSKSRPTTFSCGMPTQAFQMPSPAFSVYCNSCDKPIPDVHWHCSICDDGDFDLCRECVENQVLCGVDGHWLIKRFVKNGRVITSTTETIAPKKNIKTELEKEVPGAFISNNKEEDLCSETIDMTTRTCNSCVGAFHESNFVTCNVCEDYDLCVPCHVGLKHGHHPSHEFTPACEETTLDLLAHRLCAPGRNMRHFAICDGCDKDIYGVRHKCMNCPDWDYCSRCVKNARHIHPGHRFVPIYETISNPSVRSQRHYGIFCDGPLCKGKGHQSYIVGDRYKCAVCNDTDFCANCEALPTHRHNRTHPLIKFRTPVRNVSVTTLGEKDNGEPMYTMGDKPAQTSSRSTETIPAVQSANAATQVQTIAEVEPTEQIKEEPKAEKAHAIHHERNFLRVEPKLEKLDMTKLEAHFLCDLVADGTQLPPNHQFVQNWTMRNPGPTIWPAGCSVRFIGGDNMLNVDPLHPSSTTDLAKATESNVIGSEVAVGEEVDFSITMKSPPREGKAISYWRLKAANGTPFGHKLWCDIDVCTVRLQSHPIVETEHIEDIAKGVKKEESAENHETNVIDQVQEAPKDEQKVEPKDEPKGEPKKEHESQMIFPKLDKESPVSSTHEARDMQPSVSTEEQELVEDVESLGMDDDDETDDGFLTDEEYDIVDASDEEFMDASQGKK